ncbi:putative monogalactosyldiacylglycerol synthase, chloroplastic [Vitis vinifera]|uniref:monogalactosyldiacylglycerol synthase n=1 Tax=Vitis vinifera TaxID=29760 RepID=A0A438KF11_VITVI|nr:putative monogalactosyldiacylglycerol synthase, chloroplastic [Vitis vinifera]
MQHVPLRILRAKGLLKKIVFTTVVTDLSTCHPTWFHKLVTRCYCPTTDVAKRALKAGLQSSQIKVYGLPVRPSFVKPVRPKDELRKELGMDEDLPAVLLMGGGEGMGPIEATARALGNALYNEDLGEPIGQVLVICGRNKKLADKLRSIPWKIPVQVLTELPISNQALVTIGPIRVYRAQFSHAGRRLGHSYIIYLIQDVKGFVTKMEECMGACDCIITKAGPGTIAEAMIRGLPIILNDYIAGQIKVMRVYLVSKVIWNEQFRFMLHTHHSLSQVDVALYTEACTYHYRSLVLSLCTTGSWKCAIRGGKWVWEIFKVAKGDSKDRGEWFGPKAEELAVMSQNALKLARPDAVFKIVHDLHELVRQRSFVTQYSCTT